MSQARLNWNNFKNFVNNRKLNIHERPLEDSNYLLEAHDGPVSRYCKIRNNTSDYTDYVDNYKTSANKTYTDSDGATLSRTKATRSGWSYQLHSLEFTTAKNNSMHNESINGNDLGYCTFTMYNDQDVETTTNSEAVKTVVEWEPNYDYEIIGAKVTQSTPPNDNVRVWVQAVPDYAGPIFAEGGINLKLTSNIDVDGRAAKLLKNDNPVPGSGKFKIVCKHSAGFQHEIQLLLEIFKS